MGSGGTFLPPPPPSFFSTLTLAPSTPNLPSQALRVHGAPDGVLDTVCDISRLTGVSPKGAWRTGKSQRSKRRRRHCIPEFVRTVTRRGPLGGSKVAHSPPKLHPGCHGPWRHPSPPVGQCDSCNRAGAGGWGGAGWLKIWRSQRLLSGIKRRGTHNGAQLSDLPRYLPQPP